MYIWIETFCLGKKLITPDCSKKSIYCEKDELLLQLYSVSQKHRMIFEHFKEKWTISVNNNKYIPCL